MNIKPQPPPARYRSLGREIAEALVLFVGCVALLFVLWLLLKEGIHM